MLRQDRYYEGFASAEVSIGTTIPEFFIHIIEKKSRAE